MEKYSSLTKEGGSRTYAVVDAAMTELLRPALYNAEHLVIPVLEKHHEEVRDNCTVHLYCTEITGSVHASCTVITGSVHLYCTEITGSAHVSCSVITFCTPVMCYSVSVLVCRLRR